MERRGGRNVNLGQLAARKVAVKGVRVSARKADGKIRRNLLGRPKKENQWGKRTRSRFGRSHIGGK